MNEVHLHSTPKICQGSEAIVSSRRSVPSILLSHCREVSAIALIVPNAAALTFVGVGFFDVGLQVMLGRLDKLADCCFTSQELSRAEVIELMKSRLKPLKV